MKNEPKIWSWDQGKFEPDIVTKYGDQSIVNLKQHFFIMYIIEYRPQIKKVNTKYGHESNVYLNQQISQIKAMRVAHKIWP